MIGLAPLSRQAKHAHQPGQHLAWAAVIRPPQMWLFVSFDGLRCGTEATQQEVELGAAIDRTLQQLEVVDLPLVLSADPRQTKAGTNRGPILSEADSEALDHPHSAGTSVGQPSVEGGGDAGLGRRGATAAVDHPIGDPSIIYRVVALTPSRIH